MTNRRISMTELVILTVILSINIFSCGNDDEPGEFQKTSDYVDYQDTPKESVIVTGEADYIGPTDTIHQADQIMVDGEPIDSEENKFCSDPDAKMDLIVVDGEVVDVICYPPPTEENMTQISPDQGDTDIPQNANNTVIVFDETTDGEVIEGDISVDGNNVAIYGNGADKTIVEGDVTISGNNARVRGLYIKGDVTLDLNNTALLFCVVEGNITIKKNNVTVAATDVYGNVTVEGNNAVLVQNRVQGNWEIIGLEQFCDGNHAFQDDNGNFMIENSEIGGILDCQENAFGETETEQKKKK